MHSERNGKAGLPGRPAPFFPRGRLPDQSRSHRECSLNGTEKSARTIDLHLFSCEGTCCRFQLHFEMEYKFISKAAPAVGPFISEALCAMSARTRFEAGMPSNRSRFETGDRPPPRIEAGTPSARSRFEKKTPSARSNSEAETVHSHPFRSRRGFRLSHRETRPPPLFEAGAPTAPQCPPSSFEAGAIYPQALYSISVPRFKTPSPFYPRLTRGNFMFF